MTKNKKFKKLSNDSIYCSKDTGPFFPFIGFRDIGKRNMSQGVYQYSNSNYFENYNDIIPNEKKIEVSMWKKLKYIKFSKIQKNLNI